jgi:hypothetical protein
MNIPIRVWNGFAAPAESARTASPGLPWTYDGCARRARNDLAKDVLLVDLVVVAVRDQLQRFLAVEDRPFDFGLLELHAHRYELTARGAPAEVAARAKLDVQQRGAARAVEGQQTGVVVLALGVPILVDGLEIGLQRERERLRLGEQMALLRVDPPGVDDVGFGPRLGELFELCVVGRGDPLLRQQRRGAEAGEESGRCKTSNHGGGFYNSTDLKASLMISSARHPFPSI